MLWILTHRASSWPSLRSLWDRSQRLGRRGFPSLWSFCYRYPRRSRLLVGRFAELGPSLPDRWPNFQNWGLVLLLFIGDIKIILLRFALLSFERLLFQYDMLGMCVEYHKRCKSFILTAQQVRVQGIDMESSEVVWVAQNKPIRYWFGWKDLLVFFCS